MSLFWYLKLPEKLVSLFDTLSTDRKGAPNRAGLKSTGWEKNDVGILLYHIQPVQHIGKLYL